MLDWTTIIVLALGSVSVLYLGRYALWNGISHPLPPGPPGLPWVGNVVGINPHTPWTTYGEWARMYGDLVYSRLLGKDMIIISSEQVAKDLLENRSRNYSDRPYSITAELTGVNCTSAFLTYGDRWRAHRRIFHQTFRVGAVLRFIPYQHRQACNLLRRLFDAPEQLDDHMFEYTTAIILNSAYDYDPVSRKDRFIDIISNILDIITPVLRPDISLIVGAFPWILHLPSWFPGMSFKREMGIARGLSKEYLELPFEYALRKAPSSSGAPSMVHDALREMEEKGISPEKPWMDHLKEASGTAFLAASGTSNSTLMTFFLMMVLNPDAQKKAQAQIDALLCNTRLPALGDRPCLPFIDAILWETLRYSPPAPLSLPHAATDDDMYGGFHIPKGSLLIANLWAMAHDESKYPDSHAFLPERFINDDGSLKPNDIEHIAYGFGRRICPGRYFADTTVWMAIAKVLAVYKILKALDANGVEIPVEPKFSHGITIRPLPFNYRIVPRFPEMNAEKLEKLIAESHA